MRINTVAKFTKLRNHLYINRAYDYSIAEATLEAALAMIEVDYGLDFIVGKLRIEFRTEFFDKEMKNQFVALILSQGRLLKISGNLLIWIDKDDGHD
jgi:hypothetical protein